MNTTEIRTQNNSITPNVPFMLVLFNYTFPATVTPGNRWSVLCNNNCVFSRTSYTWVMCCVVCCIRLVELGTMALRLNIARFLSSPSSFHRREAPRLYPFTREVHLGRFRFWTIVKNAATNIPVQVFVWTYVVISLVYIPWGGITGPYGKFICNIIRNGHTAVCAFPGIAPFT